MLWIHNARIFAAFAVVLLHVAVFYSSTIDLTTADRWAVELYDVLFRWSVPIFVMISGALLLNPQKTENCRIFYQKRMSKIIIPTLFWSAFFTGWLILKLNVINQESFDLTFYVNRFLDGSPYYHLWYLYMLIPLYLFTPFLKILVRHSSHNQLWLLTLLLFAYALINQIHIAYTGSNGLFINLFLMYLPYYLAGYLLAQTNSLQTKHALIMLSLGILIATLAQPLELLMGFAYFDNFLSINTLLISIPLFLLFKRFADRPFFNMQTTLLLSTTSFGIYLIHPIFIESFAKLYNLGTGFYLITIPAIAVGAFILSTLITKIMQLLPIVRKTV